MPWRDTYDSKKTTAAQALAAVQDGMNVFVGSGCSEPQLLVDALVARAPSLRSCKLYHILTMGRAGYAKDEACKRAFRHEAFFVGPNVRKSVNEGDADFVPVFLSEIPSLFHRRQIPIDVALVQLSPPDEHGFCSFGVSVDIVKAAAENARHVIAEINPLMPRTLGDSFIHVNKLAAAVESDVPVLTLAPDPPAAAHERIGEQAARLIPDGATLQMGIGGIPDAVLRFLGGKRSLGIHTEMFSDGIIDLVERGVITNSEKTLHRGKIVASFCMGSRRLYDFVDNNPLFEFRPSEYVNDPFIIAQNANMVAINSAIEVDLTGQVCADTMGTVQYSGFGGQVDFIRGASRSQGGVPIIALPATAAGGGVSRIVPRLKPGATVTTSRGDVRWVVTEYGAVNLFGRNLRERARLLISIADPRFRGELEAHVAESKLLRSA